jgi:hypothetical protein
VSTKRSVLVGLAFVLFAALVLSGVAVAPSFASQDKGAAKGGTERFLIISPHTEEQCLAVLDDMAAKEPQILAKTEWGCMAGDHTGYTMVDAKDEAAARNLVPSAVRGQAKVIKLNKFTPEQIKSFHKKS